jgi:alkanesulfonate monooxygenase SsuD/methylene tetrahydromethanopterin reductase-like flavin-dependent oxidoreductase (luciferase family)
MTWATALLAKTKQITVFATIHVAANHPVVVAKHDEISRGRAGLNIVAGWNKPEYEALGLDLAGRTRAPLSLRAGMVRSGEQDLDQRR